MERIERKFGTSEFLRQKAERVLRERQSTNRTQRTKVDPLKLIHELDLHQVELEIQNEELKLSRLDAVNAAQKYINLYDSSPVGYFTLSAQGDIVDLNLSGALMLGKDRKSLTNSHFGFFIADETKAIFSQFLTRVFNSNSIESCEVFLQNSPNEPVYAHLTGVQTEHNNQCHVNATDITRLRQAEIEIQKKNKELTTINAEKDILLSVLAHDLRSPFSVFLGLTEILAGKLQEIKQDKLQKLASALRVSALNVYQLVDNLLEWTRMKRELTEFIPETVKIADVIGRCIGMQSELAIHKQMEIKLQVPDNLYVKVDVTMLESTLRNLISNAIKFSYRGGKVHVLARTLPSNFIEVAVSDSGTGIDASLLSKIFSINEKKGRNGTEGEPSTGLGLMLCKEFVERNGGEIWAESIERTGSTFSFTIPRVSNPPAPG